MRERPAASTLPQMLEESFLIWLDDMFLFQRGWAFTSVSPGIGKETSKK